MGTLIDFLDESIQDLLAEEGMQVKPAYYLRVDGVDGAESSYFTNTSKGKAFVPSSKSSLKDRISFDNKDEAAKVLADLEAKEKSDGKELKKSKYEIEKGVLDKDQVVPDAAKKKVVEAKETDEVKTKQVIADLINTDWSKDNETQMKAVQLLK